MCNICDTMPSGGDMSPRLWICEDNHEVRGFLGPMISIRKHAEAWDIPVQRVAREAYNLLKTKQNEAKANNGIYFCEDHFQSDLDRYLENKYPNPKPNTPDIEDEGIKTEHPYQPRKRENRIKRLGIYLAGLGVIAFILLVTFLFLILG